MGKSRAGRRASFAFGLIMYTNALLQIGNAGKVFSQMVICNTLKSLRRTTRSPMTFIDPKVPTDNVL